MRGSAWFLVGIVALVAVAVFGVLVQTGVIPGVRG